MVGYRVCDGGRRDSGIGLGLYYSNQRLFHSYIYTNRISAFSNPYPERSYSWTKRCNFSLGEGSLSA